MLNGFNFFKHPFITDALSSINFSHPEHTIDKTALSDIGALQNILKDIYGKSPWSYSIFIMELTPGSKSIYFNYLIGKKIVGFIGIRIQGINAHITNLSILTEYQGKGYGGQLMTYAVDYSIRRGCREMTLEVSKENLPAIALYERFGFTVRGLKKAYYKRSGEDALDMIYYLRGDDDVSID